MRAEEGREFREVEVEERADEERVRGSPLLSIRSEDCVGKHAI